MNQLLKNVYIKWIICQLGQSNLNNILSINILIYNNKWIRIRSYFIPNRISWLIAMIFSGSGVYLVRSPSSIYGVFMLYSCIKFLKQFLWNAFCCVIHLLHQPGGRIKNYHRRTTERLSQRSLHFHALGYLQISQVE